MIGQADANVSAKKMTININGSSVNVNATGTDSGAGGLIGVNTAVFTGPNEDATIASGAGLNISAANGYAGYIAGLNSGTINGNGTHTYTLNATIGNCNNSSSAPENMVIGNNTGTVNFKYKINGITYTLPATP